MILLRAPNFPFGTTVVLVALIAMLSSAAAEAAPPGNPAASATPASSGTLSGLPDDWNPKIPIPPDAKLDEVGQLRSAVREVQFSAPGSLDQLIAFYTAALKKAGFSLSRPVRPPSGKAFNVSFAETGTINSLSIFPDSKDTTKFAVRITYTVAHPVTPVQRSAAPSGPTPPPFSDR